MGQFIGCDAHKKFSTFASINEKGEYGPTERVGHQREVFRRYLQELPPHSEIALETSGCYYWMVDEMEQAGHIPRLAHAFTAKRRMEGSRHKTNERDARGLAMLLRNGTLPVVWIPPGELRDQREMLRWRMTLSSLRTRIKNRIHGVLQRYNLAIAVSDLFGDRGRAELLERQNELPIYSRRSVLEQLDMVDRIETEIRDCERVLEEMLYPSVERDLLDSLPCVGKVLSAVLALELGDVRRFSGPDRVVSYAGLVPVARESAEWKRQERCPRACNVYLKWAYVEAANLISIQRHRWQPRHVARLYERVKEQTNLHGKAVVAVARHLAEASYWMLTKQQVYQEPKSRLFVKKKVLSSTHG
jgi:transposase